MMVVMMSMMMTVMTVMAMVSVVMSMMIRCVISVMAMMGRRDDDRPVVIGMVVGMMGVMDWIEGLNTLAVFVLLLAD